MRRITDLHDGAAKTDARDVAIIAEAAHTLPHLKLTDEQIAEFSMLSCPRCHFSHNIRQGELQ